MLGNSFPIEELMNINNDTVGYKSMMTFLEFLFNSHISNLINLDDENLVIVTLMVSFITYDI